MQVQPVDVCVQSVCETLSWQVARVPAQHGVSTEQDANEFAHWFLHMQLVSAAVHGPWMTMN